MSELSALRANNIFLALLGKQVRFSPRRFESQRTSFSEISWEKAQQESIGSRA